MALLNIFQDRKLVPIPNLIRIVLAFIYEKANTKYSAKEIEGMIVAWVDWVSRQKAKQYKHGDKTIYTDLRPVGTKGTEWDEVEFWIQWMAQRLVQDEQNSGEVVRNKRDILEHGVMYQKIYRFPEVYTHKDFAEAMKALKKCIDQNPEDYR